MKAILVCQNNKIKDEVSKYLDTSNYDIGLLSKNNFISNGQVLLDSEEIYELCDYDYMIYAGEDFNFLSKLTESTLYKFCIIIPMSTELDYRTLYALHQFYYRSIAIIPSDWINDDLFIKVKHICRINGLSWNILKSNDSVEKSIDYIEDNYL